jgi:hypothetical protein
VTAWFLREVLVFLIPMLLIDDIVYHDFWHRPPILTKTTKNTKKFCKYPKFSYTARAFRNMAAIAQLVRASDCESEGRGFEPLWPPHQLQLQFFLLCNVYLLTFFSMSDFAKDLAGAAPIQSYTLGKVVAGTVVVSNRQMILVDLEGQFTGIITGNHMQSSTEDTADIGPGDRIESIIIGDDAHSGLIHLSLRKASQVKLIEKLHSNFDTKEIITVVPNEANKGGLLIDLDGIKGFIPVSQLTPVHYPRVENANALENRSKFALSMLIKEARRSSSLRRQQSKSNAHRHSRLSRSVMLSRELSLVYSLTVSSSHSTELRVSYTYLRSIGVM